MRENERVGTSVPDTNYSKDVLDRNIIARPDGTLGLRKGSRKISFPSAWMVATNGLGQYLAHLSASQKETEFMWNEFHVFTDWVHAYFCGLLL
jgi:hypothetical protein